MKTNINAKNVKIWCFIGPSGTGKTVLTKAAIKRLNELKPNTVGEIVSHTTRAMRDGEIEGVHYYYVSKEEFDSLEKVEQTCYSGNHYCVSKKEMDKILSQYDKIFVVVEINGYNQLKDYYGDEVGAVFIDTPVKLLEERLIHRGDKPEDIERRMKNLEETHELENIHKCDLSFLNLWPYLAEEDIFDNFLGFCINRLEIL